jgi:Fe-S cluster assembly scaffold protein SufB
MTEVASAGTTERRRPVRRSPGEIPFHFPDRDLVEALVSERGEPDWLRDDRLAALTTYDALPVEANQLYTTYVDLRGAQLETVRPYVNPDATATDTPARAPGATLEDGIAGVIEIREGAVTALELARDVTESGVTLETFAAALARDPDGFRADIEGGATLPANDKLAALARGFWSQGVRVAIPDGVAVERPLLIRWAAGVPDRALVSRTIVRLGRGATATIVEELVPSGPKIECAEGETVPQAFFAGTMEVRLGDGARLAVASLQELPAEVVAFQHRHSTVGEGASLRWALAQLGGRLVRSRVDNFLEGDRSSVEQVEIVFGSEDQVFDLTSFTRHLGRDTVGNLLSKGALFDAARSYMKGLITIEKSAIGTDSFLGEFGMNLSKKARAVAIPSLEIDQPDCRRAAHSSSVGPIDESQVFYLESRGIPPDEARKFIVLGFLEPVVARVPLADAQDRLRRLLDEKWDASAPEPVPAMTAA